MCTCGSTICYYWTARLLIVLVVFSALHMASANGHLDIVNYLINNTVITMTPEAQDVVAISSIVITGVSLLILIMSTFCIQGLYVNMLSKPLWEGGLLENTKWFSVSITTYTSTFMMAPPKVLVFQLMLTVLNSASLVISVINLYAKMKKAHARLYYEKPSNSGGRVRRVRFLGYTHFVDVLQPTSTLIYAVLNMVNDRHQHTVTFVGVQIVRAAVLITGSHQILLTIIRESGSRARRRDDGTLVEMVTLSDIPSNEYLYIMQDLPDLTEALRMIRDVDVDDEQRTLGVKIVSKELSNSTPYDNTARKTHILSEADGAIWSLIQLLREFFDLKVAQVRDSTDSACALVPYSTKAEDLLYRLRKAFKVQWLADAVQERTLERLIPILLGRLNENQKLGLRQLKSLSKACDKLMTAAILHANPTYSLVVLINNLGLQMLHDEDYEDLISKYLTTMIDQGSLNRIGQVDRDSLLSSINDLYSRWGVRRSEREASASATMVAKIKVLFELQGPDEIV